MIHLELSLYYFLQLMLCCPVFSGNVNSSVSVDTNNTCPSCNLNVVHSDLYLDCSNLELNNISVSGSYRLRYLNLSHNKMDRLPSLDASLWVEWIDLSYNEIKVLSKISLQGLKSEGLRVLILTNNKILIFQTELLSSPVLRCLQLVDLSNNQLNKLSLANLSNVGWHKLVKNVGSNNRTNCYMPTNDSEVNILYRTVFPSNNCSKCDGLWEPCEYVEWILSCFQIGGCNYSQMFKSSTVCQNLEDPAENGDLHCNLNSTTPILSTSSPPGNSAGTSETLLFSSSGESTVHLNSGSNDSGALPIQIVVWVSAGVAAMLFICAAIYKGLKYCKQRRMERRYDKWLSVYTPKSGASDTLCNLDAYASHPLGFPIPPYEEESEVEVELRYKPTQAKDQSAVIRTGRKFVKSMLLTKETIERIPKQRISSWI